MVLRKLTPLVSILLLCCSCHTTRLTESAIYSPDVIRAQPDIRIEEIYLYTGDTIKIDQSKLLASWFKKDKVALFDHDGEFLNLRLNEIEGIKVRYKDFKGSVSRTYVLETIGGIIAIGFTLGFVIYLIIIFA